MALTREERQLVRQHMPLAMGALLVTGIAKLASSNLGQKILGKRRDELFHDDSSQLLSPDGIEYFETSISKDIPDEKEDLVEKFRKEKEKNKRLREKNKKIKNSVRDIVAENKEMRKRLAILDARRGGAF